MQYTFNESKEVTEKLPRYVTKRNDFSYEHHMYVSLLHWWATNFVALSPGKLGMGDDTGMRLCFFSMRSWLLLQLIKHAYPPLCSLLFVQQLNAENSPRADLPYTFVAQGATQKDTSARMQALLKTKTVWVRVNGSTTNARLLEF